MIPSPPLRSLCLLPPFICSSLKSCAVIDLLIMVASELSQSALAAQAEGQTQPPSFGAGPGEAAAAADQHQQQQQPALGSAVESKLRNRADQSISPYVQSHADSPVAWQILDDETVERAKRENKLIFLNVGFKACHCT